MRELSTGGLPHATMNLRLQRIAAALGNLASRVLCALRVAAERSPNIVPGLLAWLEHAVAWELDRRNSRDYKLAEPMEAIPPEEVSSSLAALHAISDAFNSSQAKRDDGTAAGILELLDATAATLRIEAGRSASVLH